jgi:drug/metabolite transporter (DMT)-like permease
MHIGKACNFSSFYLDMCSAYQRCGRKQDTATNGKDSMSIRRTAALFGVSAILFGGTFVGAKAGLPYFPPLLFVAIRFDIGAVVLASYAVHQLSPADLRPRTTDDILAILSTGIVVIGMTNALIFVGQQYITSGVAAIMMSLNPILTPVFAAFLLHEERLSTRGILGLILGLVGVAFVANPDPSNLIGSIGLPILFAAAVTGAIGAVGIRWTNPTLSSTARTAWGVPLAALLTHGLSVLAGESAAAISLTPIAVLSLAYVGVGSGAVAYLTYFDLIDTVGATRANLLFYLTPVVSTLGGWLLLGETISLVTIGGFMIIFIGFVLLGSGSIAVVVSKRLPRTWKQWTKARMWVDGSTKR